MPEQNESCNSQLMAIEQHALYSDDYNASDYASLVEELEDQGEDLSTYPDVDFALILT